MGQTVQFTTERFYMEHTLQHGPAALKRHVNRYKWAASHLDSSMLVLDAGCGSGYGDHILAEKCAGVMGVDKSREAIEYAEGKAADVENERLTYEVQDLAALELPQRRFDAAVCIEVIEHLTGGDQIRFLTRLRWALKDGGMLLITTPRKHEDGPMTHYHLCEMNEKQFKGLLLDFFAQIEFDDPAKFNIPENFMLAVCHGVRI